MELSEFMHKYGNSNKYELYFYNQLSDSEFGGEISTKYSNCSLIKAAFKAASAGADLICILDYGDYGSSFAYYEFIHGQVVRITTT